MDVRTAIRDRLEQAGCTGTACAVALDGGDVVDLDADVPGFASFAGLASYTPSAPGDPTDDEMRIRLSGTAALDPARGSRTTARESVRLLCAIWNDEAGPPEAYAAVRSAMAQQLTRHRIAAGFPPGVHVAATSAA
jgi:beta-lactamase class A